jgi:hypothetical protein
MLLANKVSQKAGTHSFGKGDGLPTHSVPFTFISYTNSRAAAGSTTSKMQAWSEDLAQRGTA